jgi:hypothetical protein
VHQEGFDRLLADFEAKIGFEWLVALHLNDSKVPVYLGTVPVSHQVFFSSKTMATILNKYFYVLQRVLLLFYVPFLLFLLLTNNINNIKFFLKYTRYRCRIGFR